MQRFVRVALGVTLMGSASCSFSFERDQEVGPGEIAGRAVFEPGQAAPYARIAPLGTSRVRTAASDGRFLVDALAPGAWAIRFSHDDNGDGRPERAATRVVELRTAPDGATSGLILGDVELEPVAGLAGTVTLDGVPVAGASVVAYGPAELAAFDVELPVEARTATDQNGEFRFVALAAGSLFIAAFTEGAAAPPVSVGLAPGEQRAGVSLELQSNSGARNVQIELAPSPEPAELVRLDIVAAGSAAPVVDPGSIDAAASNVRAGAASLVFEIDPGEWDVYATTSTGRRGALLGQVVVPPGAPAVAWGLMLLSDADPCAFVVGGSVVEGARDCDRDALQGLPVDVQIFTECAPACADAFGAASGAESCATSAGTFDCDDDGDGQPDVTAPLACYGVEPGGDHDGDGVCDRNDPFPDCAENDPAALACGVGRPDQLPPVPVRPEFGGEPITGDAGPGPVDGGPGVDAGPPSLPVSFDVAGLDFGAVTERLAIDRAVTLTNDGQSPIVLELVSDALEFAILPPRNATLAPGASQTFVVRFSALAAGDYQGTLSITHDAAGLVAPTLPCTGTATANPGTPLVRASRTALDFGSIVPGNRAIASLTLENTGIGVALVQDVLGLGESFAVLTQLPLAIDAGGTVALAIAFDPARLGRIDATLTLVGDLGGDIVIAVSGTGVDAPIFSPLDALLALRLPADTGNGELEILAANQFAAGFEVDLPPTALIGDEVQLVLFDQLGGSVQVNDPVVAAGLHALSVDASALADGPVRVEARLSRGLAPDVILSEAVTLDVVKSTSGLAPPGFTQPAALTALDRVTFAGSIAPFVAGPGARVFVTGGAFAASAPLVGGASPEAFSLQVTLRRNTQNLLTLCYTDGTDTACAAPVSVVHLVPDELVIAEATSRPLTTEEVETLVAGGIVSLDDPDNFHVQEFTIVLEVGGARVAVSQPVVLPNNPTPGFFVGNGGGGGGGGGGSTSVVVVQPPGGLPPIPGVIILDGTIKSLKELFQVTLALSNTSDVLALENVAAQMVLPAGLTAIRAGLGVDIGDIEVDGPIDDVFIGTVASGSTAVAQFVVRGDVAGDYEVRLDFGGTITGPGIADPVPFDGTAFTSLSVFGAPTFDIKLVHPNAVTLGQLYDLRIEVKNTAPIPARYTTLSMNVGSGAIAPGGVCPPAQPSLFELDLGHLEPGQTAVRTIRLESCLTGDITGCQLRADENLSVEVVAGTVCPQGTTEVPFDLPDGFDPPSVLAIDPLPNRTLDGQALTLVSAVLTGEVANLRADTFLDAADPSSFSAAGTFVVEQLELSGNNVIARVPVALAGLYDGTTDSTAASLTFANALSPDARYRVTLKGGADGVRNVNSGLPLASDFSWVFFTDGIDDGLAPQVAATFPLDNGSVDAGSVIQVSFNERIDPSSVTVNLADYTLGTFALVQNATVNVAADITGGTPFAGALSLTPNGRTITFTSNPPLPAGGSFHVRVAGIRDVFGSVLPGVTLVGFNTGPPDNVAPAVPTVDPVVRFTAAASALVQGRTEAYARVEVGGGAQTILGSANALGRFGVLVPLAVSTDHTLSVTSTDLNGNASGAQTLDTAGNNLVTARDLTPPTLSVVSPADSSVVTGRAVVVDYTTADPFGPGVDRVQLTFEGRLLDQAFAPAGQVRFNSEELDNGLRPLNLWARDAVGNWGGPFVLTLDVQNPALPRVDAIAPAGVEPGATTRVVISGDNVETATAVTVDPPEVTAVIAGTSGFDLLVDLTVPFDLTPAAVTLTVTNGFGSGSTADTGIAAFVRAPALNLQPLAELRPHAGDQDRTFALTGTGFLPSTEVLVGASPVSTTVQDGGSLSFVIPGDQMATLGALGIAARSPDPVLVFRNSNTRTLTVVEPALSFVEPALTLVASDVRTVTVESSELAEAGGLVIDLDIDDGAVLSTSAQVTIPAGQTSVTTDLSALTAGAAAVTASAAFTQAGALDVLVIDPPTPVFAQQSHPTLPLVARTFTVGLDTPAPTDGIDLSFIVTGGLASAESISFAAGESSLSFALTGVAPGDDVVTASTVYGTSAAAAVLVREALGESNPAPIRAADLNNLVFIDVATDGVSPVTGVEVEMPDLWSAVDVGAITATLDGSDVIASVARGAIGGGPNGGTVYAVDLLASPIDPGLASPVLELTFGSMQAFEVLGPSEWLVRVDKGGGIEEATRETFILVDGTAADGAGVATFATFDSGAAAVGQIVTDATANAVTPVDGETVVVSDGVAAVTYEFDTDASVVETPTLRAVDIAAAASGDDVRDALISAVNSTPSFAVSATSAGAQALDLVNAVVGISGNVAITAAVANADFATSGMAGGLDPVIVNLAAGTTGNTVELSLVNDVEIVTDAAALFADFSQQGANLNWFLQNNATFGDLVRTNVNGTPGYFVSPDSLSDGVIEVEIGALTTGDDDFIGMVFRWQDPCNFYLFDWKQLNQGASTVGKVLRRIENCDFNGDGTGGDDINANAMFNNTLPNVVAADRQGGWQDNVFHRLRVELEGPRIQIFVDDLPSIDFTDPTPYLDGGYGPYSNSQANTAIRNLRVSRTSVLIDVVEVELPIALGSPAVTLLVDGGDRTVDLVTDTGPGGGPRLTLPAAGLIPGTGLYQLILSDFTAPAAGDYPFVIRTSGQSGNLEPIFTPAVLTVVP